MSTLAHLAVLTGTVLLSAQLLSGVRVRSTLAGLGVAVVFSLLNWALGGVLLVVAKFVLFLPAIFTLGLIYAVVPFVVNAVLLWLTDKALKVFEIRDFRSLAIMSGLITLANGIFAIIKR